MVLKLELHDKLNLEMLKKRKRTILGYEQGGVGTEIPYIYEY